MSILHSGHFPNSAGKGLNSKAPRNMIRCQVAGGILLKATVVSTISGSDNKRVIFPVIIYAIIIPPTKDMENR